METCDLRQLFPIFWKSFCSQMDIIHHIMDILAEGLGAEETASLAPLC